MMMEATERIAVAYVTVERVSLACKKFLGLVSMTSSFVAAQMVFKGSKAAMRPQLQCPHPPAICPPHHRKRN
ncbi:hypothetical protein BaRGS_00029771 [Batillaria attramentaria]|uniref:Uncharacterized protein n=1 Tax=Batillaria attramentaria TaxID=370345 RepID=A0ABD0JWH4_9CAEN